MAAYLRSQVLANTTERARIEQTCVKVFARHLLTFRLICCLFDGMNALFPILCWDLFIVKDCECVMCHPVIFIKCFRLPLSADSIFTVFTLNCNVHPVVSIVSPKSEVQSIIRDDTNSTFVFVECIPNQERAGYFVIMVVSF